MTDLQKKVYHGPAENIMPLLADNSVDVILTSPPYADQRKGIYDGIPPEKYSEWFIPIAREIYRVMKPTGSFFLNIKSHIYQGEVHDYVDELKKNLRKEAGFKFIDEFAWVKQGYPGKMKGRFKNAWEPVFHFTKVNPDKIKFNPFACGTPVLPQTWERYNRKRGSRMSTNGSGFSYLNPEIAKKHELALPSNVLKISAGNNQYTYQKHHPATFPEKFAEFFILSFSNPGDVILDPFAGSGTTGRVAWRNGRGFIMIEKKELYHKRLDKWASELNFQSNLLLK